MVTSFIHGELLQHAVQAPFIPVDTLCGDGGVLVLAPHPDDETLGCGAAIAAAAQSGHQVTVAVVTDGAKSHRNSKRYPPEALAIQRHKEVTQALHTLAPEARLEWLGYPDWGAPDSPEEIAQAITRLQVLATEINASALWANWVGDPHSDHAKTARLASVLHETCSELTRWAYVVWGRFETAHGAALPYPNQLYRFDSGPWHQRKRAALAEHASQMTTLIDDDPEGFMMEPVMQNHFIDTPEIFIREDAQQ